MSVMDGAIVNEKYTPAWLKGESLGIKRQTRNSAPHAQVPWGIDPLDTPEGKMSYKSVRPSELSTTAPPS